MKKYVIIGNGTAAVGCIEGIRAVDRDGAITVASGEARTVYSRPLISYYLEGKTDLERMKYRGDTFYADNGCQVLYGRKATGIDPAQKTVQLDDGTALAYDKLCVAAGSRSFVPPFAGLDSVKDRFTFMTLDDALALEQALGTGRDKRVLIVGAGLIGLKCAEGIIDRAKSITVCDLADRVLSSILDAECAAIVQQHLEAHGITFMLGDTAVKFDGGSAEMKSGRNVEFDVLVLAVGVRANTELVKAAGGSVNRGIIVNEKLETDLPDVYAAGDCTEGFDASLGDRRVLAILPNAYAQGQTAGTNMAGGDRVLDNAIPMNSIGFFGLHMMTAGSYTGEMTETRSGQTLRRFFVKDGLLKGFMLIGDTVRAGIYTSLIRDRIPLETLEFGPAAHEATSAMYSRETRRKKFGGVV
jgi:NAD(P)H-nitrite reductase large subunit